MALMVGRREEAVPLLEESLSLFGELGDRQGSARALLILGNCAQIRDVDRALELLAESAAVARQAGDTWCLTHALGLTGNIYSSRSDLRIARPLFEPESTV